VRNKADSLFKIVGAASCAAKVTRDFLVDGWVWEETASQPIGTSNKTRLPRGRNADEAEDVNNGLTVLEGHALWGTGKDLGSGYPSDPNTKAWIQKNLDKTFGFPNVARFSWAPIRNAIEENGHKVLWYALISCSAFDIDGFS
jgi:ribonuclease H2 subunit A